MKILVCEHCPASDHSIRTQLKGITVGYRHLGHEPAVWGTRRVPGRTLPGLVRWADFVHFLYHGIGLSEREDRLLRRAWQAAVAGRKPYGVTFQGHPRTRITPPKARWQRQFLVHAAWASALTPFSARRIVHVLPYMRGRLTIVPNGLDREAIASAAELGLARTTARASKPFVFCAAREDGYKGLDVLLWAWKDVAAQHPDVRLIIAGRSDPRRRMRRLARLIGVDARFLGALPRRRVCELMRACLFFTLPSRDESFGMAALEAMAFGRAVLATRTGPSAFIASGRTGLLVPPKDPGALRSGLLRLLEDRCLRSRLGQAASRAAARLRWEDSARAFERLIRRRATLLV